MTRKIVSASRCLFFFCQERVSCCCSSLLSSRVNNEAKQSCISCFEKEIFWQKTFQKLQKIASLQGASFFALNRFKTKSWLISFGLKLGFLFTPIRFELADLAGRHWHFPGLVWSATMTKKPQKCLELSQWRGENNQRFGSAAKKFDFRLFLQRSDLKDSLDVSKVIWGLDLKFGLMSFLLFGPQGSLKETAVAVFWPFL